eukprot:s1488_g6.t1
MNGALCREARPMAPWLALTWLALASAEVRLRAGSTQHRLQNEAPTMPWEDIPIEAPKESQCGPKCQYLCEQPNCPGAQCAPLCDPPACKTSCSTQRDHCETRCGEPLCAVVCPQVECKGNDCSDVKCQTVCSPPVCSTSCAETCHTQCAKPKCQWRCKANPACPAPKCKMNCTDLDCATTLSAGNATAAKLKKALMRDGKVIVSEGQASLDPNVLVAGVAMPAPAPAKVVVEEPKDRQEPKVLPAAAPAAATAAAPAAVAPSPAAAPAVAPAAAPTQAELGWVAVQLGVHLVGRSDRALELGIASVRGEKAKRGWQKIRSYGGNASIGLKGGFATGASKGFGHRRQWRRAGTGQPRVSSRHHRPGVWGAGHQPGGCGARWGAVDLGGFGALEGLKRFGKGYLKLVTVEGHVLTDPEASLQAAGVQDGQDLTAVVQQFRTAATEFAFAVWCCGGNNVVTGGHPGSGGDSSVVQDQFKNVQQICATDSAFAAILADGSVVAWGAPNHGGDCSAVQSQLRKVQQIQAASMAFAAILADGSVVAWGDPDSGGDCSAVQAQLRNVQQIQATRYAFAAILADGSVVVWGDPDSGGDCSAVQHQLKNVQNIQAAADAFAAILADGSVVAWGDPDSGGDCSAVQAQLRNVQQIQATRCGAFAAILADGSVVVWGDPDSGGDCSAVQGQLKNVQAIQATARAFAAILADGSVVAWGDPDLGGDCSAVQDRLKNVQQIQATRFAFAAILADGSVVAWGYPGGGGDCLAVQDRLKNVQEIHATSFGFTAILTDGSVVIWGAAFECIAVSRSSRASRVGQPRSARFCKVTNDLAETTRLSFETDDAGRRRLQYSPEGWLSWEWTPSEDLEMGVSSFKAPVETQTQTAPQRTPKPMAPQPVTVADFRAQFRAQQGAEERGEGEASPAEYLACSTEAELKRKPPPQLGLEKYLTLWILLAVALGIAVGQFEGVRHGLHALKVGNTNLLTAMGMIVMLLPPFATVKYDEFGTALRRIPKRIAIGSVGMPWARPFLRARIGPFLMLFIGLATLHKHADLLQGVMYIGAARCIAMVLVWTAIAGGDQFLCVSLVLLNSVITVVTYAPMVTLLGLVAAALGVEMRGNVGFFTVLQSVLIYLGIPLLLGILMLGADY